MKSGASNASFTYTLFIRFAMDTNEFQAEHYIHLLILWPEVTRIPSFEQHPIWFSVFFTNWIELTFRNEYVTYAVSHMLTYWTTGH